MTEFEKAYREDDNHWWYSESGDCQNAYDDALEELDNLREEVKILRDTRRCPHPCSEARDYYEQEMS